MARSRRLWRKRKRFVDRRVVQGRPPPSAAYGPGRLIQEGLPCDQTEYPITYYAADSGLEPELISGKPRKREGTGDVHQQTFQVVTGDIFSIAEPEQSLLMVRHWSDGAKEMAHSCLV